MARPGDAYPLRPSAAEWTVELLPSREALGTYNGGGYTSVEDVQHNEANGLIAVNALNFNHSGLVVVD
ncbi:MAG: hypothetical protein ACRDYU_13950 [Actinomycetes bacterium]